MVYNKKKYRYVAYGLSIQSEIEFPELFIQNAENKSFDINISIGKTPKKESIIGLQKPISAYNTNEYWQEIHNIARYYAKNGTEVIIEPLSDNWNDIRLFFISNVFYAILFQRNNLPISASGVINKKGEIVLFVAPSLIGKSTLLFQFMLRGYLPFTDEGCVFDQIGDNTGEIFAYASFPSLRLWHSTLNEMNITDTSDFKPIRPNIDKLSRYFESKINPSKIKLSAIIILSKSKKIKSIFIKKIDQMEAFIKLHECHPRPEWLEDMNKTQINFKMLGSLSKKTTIFLAERPYEGNDYESFVDLIQKTVFENDK